MQVLNRKNTGITKRLPIKVIQYGEGNFLRGFADYIIDKLNKEADFNAGVAVIQPRAGGKVQRLVDQDCLYNLFLKGIKNGKETEEIHTISCIQQGIDPYVNYEAHQALAEEESLQFVISNTTEAGIAYNAEDAMLEDAPHTSFPAKVTALLYRRFQYFKGAADKGLTIIPCELINQNADTLKKIILQYAAQWELGAEFTTWVEQHNSFHNTLVDRIVPGYPKDDIEAYQKQLDFKDNILVSAEVYLLWVIEGDEKLKAKIPLEKIDENILIVKDLQPYRTLKVRILNGAHTTMVPFSLLYGNTTVKESVDNAFTGKFIKEAVFNEIIPTLDMSKEESNAFAEAVFDRFRNPFIKHQLSSIALNSISKFKVRVLPSLLAFHQKYNRLPINLTFALACLIRFYKGSWRGEDLPVDDDPAVIAIFEEAWSTENTSTVAKNILKNREFWGENLAKIPDFQANIVNALELIEEEGVEMGYKKFAAQFEQV